MLFYFRCHFQLYLLKKESSRRETKRRVTTWNLNHVSVSATDSIHLEQIRFCIEFLDPTSFLHQGEKRRAGSQACVLLFVISIRSFGSIHVHLRWIYVKIPFSKENRQLCLIFKDGWRCYIFNSNSFQENVKSLLPKRIGIFMHVDLIIWRFYTRFWNDRSGQATEKQGCQEWTLTRLPPIPTIDSLRVLVPRLVQLLTDEGFHTLQINLGFLFQLFNISKSRSGSNWKLMAR